MNQADLESERDRLRRELATSPDALRADVERKQRRLVAIAEELAKLRPKANRQSRRGKQDTGGLWDKGGNDGHD